MDVDSINDDFEDLMDLDEEVEEGNIEYKSEMSDSKLERRASQMKWRVEEGNGEAYYYVGIADDGSFVGMNQEQDRNTMLTLEKICEINDYTLTTLQVVEKGGKIGRKFLIRENNVSAYIDLRVGVAGQVDSGKSTLVGVLTSGERDNGRGLSRSEVFNFKHEKMTGRTSSVSQRIIGFSPGGALINVSDRVRDRTWKQITRLSSKIVTFYDLCGHKDYLRTTISGIASTCLDYCIIMVAANAGIPKGGTTLEHISLCLTYRIPMMIVISKIDMVKDKPEVLKSTIKNIHIAVNSIKGSKRHLVDINNNNDIVDLIPNFSSGKFVPLFQYSAITTEGLDLIIKFLNLARSRIEFEDNGTVRYNIIDTFVVKGTGLVLGGFNQRGTIKAGGYYLLGPDRNGHFQKVRVKTIEVKRVRLNEAGSGKYVCVNIPNVDRSSIHKGMVMTSDFNVKAVREFMADVFVRSKKSITIKPGSELILTCNSFRGPVKIMTIFEYTTDSMRTSDEKISSIDQPTMPTVKVGERARIHFKIMKRFVYLEKDDRVVFTEGDVRVIGVVVSVL